MKCRAVPGGDAAFEIAITGGKDYVALAENLVEGRVAMCAAGLAARNRIGERLNVGG
jgi:hypothetical protein